MGGVVGTFVLAAVLGLLGVDHAANIAAGTGLAVVALAFILGMVRLLASGALAALGWREDDQAKSVLVAFGATFVIIPVAGLMLAMAWRLVA